MKTDRLIGILTVLLQKGKVTAPYLAEKFEVSRRTINRDVEDLCRAGIPLFTLRGSGGGIAIAEGYRIDKTLFTPEELRAVLAGLAGLDSVRQDRRYQQIMDKFSPDRDSSHPTGSILIDLSSHYRASIAPKIAAIQEAIAAAVCLRFTYYSKTGQRPVLLAPYFVVFQWSSWYVLGRDQAEEEFRLFKLNRLWDLEITGQTFAPEPVPEDKLAFHSYFTGEIHAVVLFGQQARYRLIDEYGPDSFTTLPDGKLRFAFPFTNREYLLEWVLSFGGGAELLEPPELRTELLSRLEQARKKYL